MRADMFAHLGNAPLLREGHALLRQKRTADATFLVWLAEVDARKLFVQEGHPSMLAFCEESLGLSEDVSLKDLQVVRAAREFPAVLDALAEGRIHVTGARLLVPHLTRGNAAGLLKAAEYKTKAEIERLIAERFPRTEMMAMVQPTSASSRPEPEAVSTTTTVTDSNTQHAPGHVEAPLQRPKVKPLSGQSFELHFSIPSSVHDKQCRAEALVSHRIRPGDLPALFEMGLDALIAQEEKAQFGTTNRKPRSIKSTSSKRHIPAHVKRAVFERDGGRCTFVSENGRRCSACTRLEYDHIIPVARGGASTVENLRLRCRAHNQHEAERLFGAGFMEQKRQATRQKRGAIAEAESEQLAEQAKDVLCGLRELGVRGDLAKRAAEHCMTLPEATLEERMRAALRFTGSRTRASQQRATDA